MTDTPRTKATLQSTFADGQVGGIRAQGIRDFVVSSPPLKQVSGDGAITHETGSGAGSWPKSIANQAAGNDVVLALTPDGNGPTVAPEVQTGSYVSSYYGQTFTANQWMRLPVGLWLVTWSAFWASNSTGYRFIQAETMDDRINITSPVYSDFWGYPGQWGLLFTSPQYHPAAANPTYMINAQIIGVPQSLVDVGDAHSTAGQGLAVSFWVHQSSGAPLNLTSVRLLAIRLSNLL